MIFKKIISLNTLLIFAAPIWAAVNSKETNYLDWILENLVLIMGVLTIIAVVISLYSAMKVLWMSQQLRGLEATGMSHANALKKVEQENFVSYIYQELIGTVPLEKEKDILLNHDYDGIQELDNNLPPWWIGMFYLSIIFGVFYIIVFHFSDLGKSQIEEYQTEVRDAEIARALYYENERKQKELESAEENVEPVALTTEVQLTAGAEVFKKFCEACHGKKGEGLEGLGQNLTDQYWIHGGSYQNILTTIINGVPSTTMISWKSALKESEIQQVASFILTLQGTNPPNARGPEGELWVENKAETKVEAETNQ